MKRFISSVIENTQPLTYKLLFTCFISGYITATVFFGFFGPEVHHFLHKMLEGL
jgi:hypothetical protein